MLKWSKGENILKIYAETYDGIAKPVGLSCKDTINTKELSENLFEK